MSAVKYQTMPPLSTDEYADLEASILANGIQVPVIVDEHGVVIDGHHRKAIAEHHGLHLPTETRAMLTEAQKQTLSIELNIARRQLNREQKRSIIEAALKAQPEKSNREHARSLGVDDKTVGAARTWLESTAEIPQFDKTVGADGKERPASRPVQQIKHIEAVEEITVDAVTGEVIEEEPTVTEHTVTEKTTFSTGLDGKTYKRPEPSAPRAEAITTQFTSVIADLNRVMARLHRVSADKNFARNKEQIASLHASDLYRTISELQTLADTLKGI